MNVAVIGASNKKDRYSYKAVKLLQECGHVVFPVHPRIKDIDGVVVFQDIKNIPEEIDTITLYVAQDVSDRIADGILNCHPKRIIFNPGAENKILFEKASGDGVECLNACTLVMLKTQQF